MGIVYIVGLGAGSESALPQGALSLLTAGHPVVLRTERHPVVRYLRECGVEFRALDEVYERADSFSEVYEEIAARVLDVAASEGSVVYAVPGHPAVAEKSVRLLRERGPDAGHAIEFGPGQSFLDDMFLRIGVDPIEGLVLVDAADVDERDINSRTHLVVVQMYNRALAADVKIALAEVYGDEHEVVLVRAIGVPGEESIRRVPLYELDRQSGIDHLTSLYVPPRQSGSVTGDFGDLLRLVARLRSPDGGCPWDLAQTHQTLRPYAIEEAYEVVRAIDDGDWDGLIDELGDLLLQVLLHSQIGRDEGYFQMRDVIARLSGKLIRRHPHVFGDAQADDAEAVREIWANVKAKERSRQASPESVLDRVKAGLPPLDEARRLHEKAAEVGFDWPDTAAVWAKVEEELAELRAAADGEREEELGDVLFTLVNWAARNGIDAQRAIAQANRKFRGRFLQMERLMRAEHTEFMQLTLEKMDLLWQNAKQKGRPNGPGDM